jgi:hypothetical protein
MADGCRLCVKRGKTEKNQAKATVRYIQHRPGDNEKIIRTLFGRDGAMEGLTPTG